MLEQTTSNSVITEDGKAAMPMLITATVPVSYDP